MWDMMLEPMWGTFQQEGFKWGAILVVVYQIAKFGELNLADPITSRYIALLPGAKVRDFASSYAYHTALIAFLGVSLIIYFLLCLLCQISPEILKGAATLQVIVDPSASPNLAASTQKIPYPLYIAATFMGLTQPFIPILSEFRNAQRNFFHDRIDVPRRIIDLSGALSSAIELRCGADKRGLASELRNLVSGDFLASLQSYGDGAYYKLQLEKLELDDEEALGRTIKESSPKELRQLIERLVLCALVAVMRRSGPKSLVKVAESLQTPLPRVKTVNGGYFVASLVSSALLFSFALLILSYIFWSLAGPVAKLFPDQLVPMWPDDFPGVIDELRYIVPPIFVSLLVAVFFLVPRDRSQARDVESNPESSLGTEFVNFFRSSAVVLAMCIVIPVLIQFIGTFYEIGTVINVPPEGTVINVPPEARTPSKLVLPLIQGFIPFSVCLFTTWYLVSSGVRPPRRGLSFTATLLAIVAATALVGLFYELTFLQDYLQANPKARPGLDHVLFGVAANVLVSVCAFLSVALFFTARDKLPEALRAHHERPEAAPSSNQDPKPPRRGLRNVGHRANTHFDANRHVSH